MLQEFMNRQEGWRSCVHVHYAVVFPGLFTAWVPRQVWGVVKASTQKAGNLEAPEHSIVLTAQMCVASFIFKIKDKQA